MKNIKFLDKVELFDSDTFFSSGSDFNKAIENARIRSVDRNYVTVSIRNEKNKILPDDIDMIKTKNVLELAPYCFDRIVYLTPEKDEVYGIRLKIDIGDDWTMVVDADFGLLFEDYSIPISKNIRSTMYPNWDLIRFDDDYLVDKEKILDIDIPIRIYGIRNLTGMKIILDDDPLEPVFLKSIIECV